MLSCHDRFDHRLLQGLTVFVSRLCPEAVIAEPAGQFLRSIVPLSAPVACGVGAGCQWRREVGPLGLRIVYHLPDDRGP